MANILSGFTTIPFGVLVVIFIAYFQMPVNDALFAMLDSSAYILYGAGMILSWWFNRSRVFFITMLLALSQYALSGTAAADTGIAALPAVLYPVLCTLLPMNIFVFSLLKERGIFNTWGLGRFAIILFQVFYVAMAITANDSTMLSFFHKEFLAEDLSCITKIPQVALLAYAAAFLLLFIRQLKTRSRLDRTFAAVLVSTMLGLQWQAEPLALPVFFAAAGIMLIIAVIQDSYSMAYLDELTGLPARRALKEELMKLRGEYTIAMVDIDFFKKFNDTYGHDTGDDVLCLVATVLRKVTGGGKAFRYGGEEFTIVFPHTPLADALPHLEKLREAIEKTPYAYRGKRAHKTKKKATKKLFVTISIGAAERSEKHAETHEVIKAADTALYRAKKKGRNCVSK
ncbi:GGDEF domain-containing protein [Sporomusa sphaeroides]|uniref:Response regulator PleD n=1 Tax=Sporomusa sphaeroides DSM 2875 TaxID=1337886 RepID=A0ABM9W5G0_9FIRM|nr:GGDEF domain-containing protein [Sporomusa sphaeroides]OLS56182.1 response regulator PleD [Sporomusa sphaeroides DSM 2875]CVK19176.1 Response regulator PleD [Sporomusa sphaeroides DSM 2875]